MTVFEERRAAVTKDLSGAGSLLVTAPVNVRYLTGFTGTNGQLLCDAGPIFFTDGRYEEQSAAEVPDLERQIYSGAAKLSDLVGKVLAERGVTKLAVEASHLTLAARDRLGSSLDGIELVPRSDLVELVRRRKDPVEIAAIRRAQDIAERAVTSVLSSWAGGTEVELALALEWAIRTGGAEAVSFDVIVATGPHSALPHATPRLQPASTDEVLLIDIGARAGGYCSDMTRTYLGPHAPEPLPKAHAAVRAALEKAVAAVQPGVKAADVDGAAREYLDGEGFGDAFVHSTGHGVGLEIHEGPSLGSTSEDVLEPGMVVTVEPGVYLPGIGGIRVEDLLVVTEEGAENLTTLDRGPTFPS